MEKEVKSCNARDVTAVRAAKFSRALLVRSCSPPRRGLEALRAHEFPEMLARSRRSEKNDGSFATRASFSTIFSASSSTISSAISSASFSASFSLRCGPRLKERIFSRCGS